MQASCKKRTSRDGVAARPRNPNGNAREGKRNDFREKTIRATLMHVLGRLASLCLIALPALTPWLPAQAQDWPKKPVRIVVPYGTGGAVDSLGRQLAEKLSLQWGQPVIVENRPGSATVTAAVLVARSPADGYTLLLTADSTMSVNPHLFTKLPYDAQKDFAPVTMLVLSPQLLTAHPSLEANTLPELIALARAKPGAINYGSPGIGSQAHLSTGMLQAAAGIDLVHVPYKGGPQAVTAVIAGEVQLAYSIIATVQSHIKAGRLKAIAIGGNRRSSLLPDVPTFAEMGYPTVGAYTWFGLFLPAGTPREVITRIYRDAARIVTEPDFRDKQIIAKGNEPVANSPEEFAAYLRKESESRGNEVKISGAKAE